MPGADAPLFQVPAGHLGLGLGIHGEPGIEDVPLLPAEKLAALLVERLVAAAPDASSTRLAPVLNGLGTTKYEELFLLWRHVAGLLRERGYTLVEPEVGELVTSLDMGGVSLTLQWLDDELERCWTADAYTPAYRKQRAPLERLDASGRGGAAEGTGEDEAAPPASDASRALAGTVRDGLRALHDVVAEHEEELGRIDAVAGDGDHGRGMLKGATAAVRSVERAPSEAGAAWLLGRAGRAWAEEAGGTSGVLWGAALEAFGGSLGDDRDAYDARRVADAIDAFAESVQDLGRAVAGDKTLLDALLPFAASFREQAGAGAPTGDAWVAAADAATEGARATADLRPRVGRARPLAEKSLGTPDAGATSFALVVTRVGELLARA